MDGKPGAAVKTAEGKGFPPLPKGKITFGELMTIVEKRNAAMSR